MSASWVWVGPPSASFAGWFPKIDLQFWWLTQHYSNFIFSSTNFNSNSSPGIGIEIELQFQFRNWIGRIQAWHVGLWAGHLWRITIPAVWEFFSSWSGMLTVTIVLRKCQFHQKCIPNSHIFCRLFHKSIINQFLNAVCSIICYWQIICGTTGQLVHFAPAFDLPSFTVSDCIQSPAMESNHDTNYLSATNIALDLH